MASSRPAGGRSALVATACFLVAALALASTFLSYEAAADYALAHPDSYQSKQIESLYRPALDRLGEGSVVGLLTDLDQTNESDLALLMVLRYVWAPRQLVVVDGAHKPEWAVSGFKAGADPVAFGARNGYALSEFFGQGIGLFQLVSAPTSPQ